VSCLAAKRHGWPAPPPAAPAATAQRIGIAARSADRIEAALKAAYSIAPAARPSNFIKSAFVCRTCSIVHCSPNPAKPDFSLG